MKILQQLLFLAMFTLSVIYAHAQKYSILQDYCDTPDMTEEQMEKLPWYGNNQFF